jgi:group I intron endonuclease
MKHCGVYIIRSKLKPERCYIGHSIMVEKRWSIHINDLKANKHHSPKLQRHFNKYELSDLTFNIICECDRCDLIPIEQFYIDAYNPYFNCSPTASSNLGIKKTEEQRAKSRGRKCSEEAKLKMSIARKGVKRSAESIEKGRISHLGKRLSEETKRKISKSHLGIRPSEETKLKQSIIHKGIKLKPHSEETRRKMSEVQKGRKLTEEHKEKLRKAKIGNIPWNKGIKTGQRVWNKGKKGVQENWKKGMKLLNGIYITANAN